MGVFVLTDQHQLVPMKSAQFVTEDEFQSLLVNFPELLSGDTAERYTPRRWLLLNREQPVPAEDGGAGRCRSITSLSTKMVSRPSWK